MTQPPDRHTPKAPRLGNWWWWLLLAGLLAWNLMTFAPQRGAVTEIPYSAFLAQVEADNVAGVEIQGDVISGSLTTSIPWPPAAAAAGAGGPAAATGGEPASTATTAAPAGHIVAFKTLFPATVGDPGLVALLAQHGVTIQAVPPPNPWLLNLLLSWGPLVLLIVFFVWMGRRTMQAQGGLFSFGRSQPRQVTKDTPKTTFADVAGVDEAKRDLAEVVDFLRHPEKYLAIGARIPRGVLLVGPPGTGKTLLARAVAGEAGVPFYSLSGSEFVEMFVGVGASRVRDLFKQAKESAPAIVFIDELDAVGRRRGAGLGTVNDEREQTLNQLLVEMDGFEVGHQIIMLAATNRPDVLDPALLRPGRFDRQVVIGLPDRAGREAILAIHARPLQLAADVDLGLLARSTTGFSGADLANLCNEAALEAARNDRHEVAMADFDTAVDKLVLGEARSLVLSPRDREVIAYHEAGHAVVAWFSPGADPVRKVTIMPRGSALGVTAQVPEEDRYNYARDTLLTRLSVMLGGRAAEELAIGDVTTGAENDLLEATRLARRMVSRWGMGALGPIAFETAQEQPFLGYEITQGRPYSEATAAELDSEVETMMHERYGTTRALLERRRPELDALVERLLTAETVGLDELTAILGRRPEAVPA